MGDNPSDDQGNVTDPSLFPMGALQQFMTAMEEAQVLYNRVNMSRLEENTISDEDGDQLSKMHVRVLDLSMKLNDKMQERYSIDYSSMISNLYNYVHIHQTEQELLSLCDEVDYAVENIGDFDEIDKDVVWEDVSILKEMLDDVYDSLHMDVESFGFQRNFSFFEQRKKYTDYKIMPLISALQQAFDEDDVNNEQGSRRSLKFVARIYGRSREELSSLLDLISESNIRPDVEMVSRTHRAYNHFVEQFDNLSTVRKSQGLAILAEKEREYFDVKNRAVSLLREHGVPIGIPFKVVGEDIGANRAAVVQVPAQAYKGILEEAETIVKQMRAVRAKSSAVTDEQGAVLDEAHTRLKDSFRKLDEGAQDEYTVQHSAVQTYLNDYIVLYERERDYDLAFEDAENMLLIYLDRSEPIDAHFLKECEAVKDNLSHSYDVLRQDVQSLILLDTFEDVSDQYTDLLDKVLPVVQLVKQAVRESDLQKVVAPIKADITPPEPVDHVRPLDLQEDFMARVSEVDRGVLNLKVGLERANAGLETHLLEDVPEQLEKLDMRLDTAMSELQNAFEGHTTFIRAECMQYKKLKADISELQNNMDL